MKCPITIPCNCGKAINLQITGTDLPEQATCSACGHTTHLMQPLGNLAVMLILERARWELTTNHDVTMTILLGTMAAEAQMSWLYFKWRAIDDKVLPHEQTAAHKTKWEKEWSDMRSIGERLDELSRLLTDTNFDKFAQQNMKWLKNHIDGFDRATSIKTFFQDQVFERRNQVIHYGNIDFEEADGKKCYPLISALLELLKAMDKQKYEKVFSKTQ
jgi:hypothetical protein